MPVVNIYEAKTQLSRLIEKAASGEDVVIGRGGRPVARITSLTPAKQPIRFGLLKGRIKLADDFDAPLPDEVLGAFEGR
ncbi:MAG: type II toxin-antitoxin system Phd/YefM family antitoxin [Sterolibacteriaceae bacterium]|uniref:Antitoxin n=1 Tax=Candidatus Methylophosphatis roskildensis TaxID=2899263 RepID=A0A9D7HLY7_9PROT|nr:type II toxin-antitoxin system Phd/YefM family antitoxin [Candidatus Methylophosphatis roskildensis]MBK7236661.1 type II toxin-antitoxin system Phd/YefM family antitoxin [Sterolibacteriaceae bacterium]